MFGEEAATRFRKDLEKSVKELRGLLQQYNSMDAIAHVMLANAVADPDKYVEALHEGQEAYVEYVALLVLMDPFHDGARWLSESDIERIQARLKDVYFNQRMLLHAEAGPPQQDLQGLADDVKSYELIVRNPGYQHHVADVLTELFSPFADWMAEHLGFTVDQALALAQAIDRIGTKKLRTAHAEGIEAAKQIRRAVRRYQNSGEIPDNAQLAEIVKAEAAVSEKKMIRHTRKFVTVGTFYALGDTFSFTAAEVAQLADVPTNVATAYLEAISTGFGEVPEDFLEPAAVHPLKLQPVVRDGKRFLLAAPTALYWGLQLLVEDQIKQDSPAWDRYQRHRNGVLERRAAESFEKAMPGCLVARNLTYPNPDMPDSPTELDALVRFNRALFLVECKAGSLTEPARRGGLQRLERHVGELLEEPLQQAYRAHRYIQGAAAATFEAPDHSVVEIRKSEIDVEILVAVTLQPLSPITTWMNQRIVGEDGPSLRRWSLSLYDLVVIADCVEFGSEFLHFVVERTGLPVKPRIEAADEVDFFGAYLCGSLRFRDDMDFVLLAGLTKPFDDYYLYEMGVRSKPAEKPKKRLVDRFHQFLQVIDGSGHPGFAEAGAMLLQLDWRTQKTFLHKLEQACRKAAGPGAGPQYFTLLGDEHGYSVMVGRREQTRQTLDDFREYSASVAAARRTRHWLCLVCDLSLELVAFTCLEPLPPTATPAPSGTVAPR